MEKRTGTQVISRTCRILRSFSSIHPELGLGEIAKLSKLHPSTVHRILQALVNEGFMVQNIHNAKYRLGVSLVGIGELAKQSNDFLRIARPYAEELERVTGEYVAIEVLNQDLRVDTLDFIPSSSYRLSEKPIYGLSVDAHCTASGKMLLAFLSEEKLDEFINRGLRAYTHKTITDPELFKKHLATILEQGYSVAESELEVGFISIAAPIFGSQPYPIAAIKVGAPTMRLTAERVKSVASLVMDVALSVSSTMQRIERS